jgi:hypothetical protein
LQQFVVHPKACAIPVKNREAFGTPIDEREQAAVERVCTELLLDNMG